MKYINKLKFSLLIISLIFAFSIQKVSKAENGKAFYDKGVSDKITSKNVVPPDYSPPPVCPSEACQTVYMRDGNTSGTCSLSNVPSINPGATIASCNVSSSDNVAPCEEGDLLIGRKLFLIGGNTTGVNAGPLVASTRDGSCVSQTIGGEYGCDIHVVSVCARTSQRR